MSTYDTIKNIMTITDRDTRDANLCTLFQLDGPGAYAIREPNGRVMVWANEADSVDDDGQKATYRSPEPITTAHWEAITRLAWIAGHQSI